MELTKNELIGLIQYTSGEIDLIDVTEQDAESILKDYLVAINYADCCKPLTENKEVNLFSDEFTKGCEKYFGGKPSDG